MKDQQAKTQEEQDDNYPSSRAMVIVMGIMLICGLVALWAFAMTAVIAARGH